MIFKKNTAETPSPAPDTLEAKAERIVVIDIMRGYAILMMLQGHVIELTLSESAMNMDNWLYALWNHFRGMTAPVFFLASGMIIAYLIFRIPQETNERRIQKNYRRVVKLLVLGYLLQFSWGAIECIYHGSTCAWEFLLRTHVLQTIGVGMLMITVLAHATKSNRVVFPIFCFVMINLAFIVGPVLALQDTPGPATRFFTAFFLKPGAAFPALPWVGFTFGGALIGFALTKWKLHDKWQFYLVAILVGYALTTFSWLILHSVYSITLNDYTAYLNYGVFTYYRLGEALMVVGVIGLLTLFVRIPRAISLIGRETLGVYFLHSMLVYGSIIGIGMKTWWKNALNPYEAIALALATMALFIGYAYIAPKLREKMPFFENLK